MKPWTMALLHGGIWSGPELAKPHPLRTALEVIVERGSDDVWSVTKNRYKRDGEVTLFTKTSAVRKYLLRMLRQKQRRSTSATSCEVK